MCVCVSKSFHPCETQSYEYIIIQVHWLDVIINIQVHAYTVSNHITCIITTGWSRRSIPMDIQYINVSNSHPHNNKKNKKKSVSLSKAVCVCKNKSVSCCAGTAYSLNISVFDNLLERCYRVTRLLTPNQNIVN